MIYIRLFVVSVLFSIIYCPVNLYSQTSLPDAQTVTVWGEASVKERY
jgi:hypothetical protein